MTRRLVLAIMVAMLAPAMVHAVARPPEPRLRPADVSPLPSYVKRVEPSVVAVHAKGAPGAASTTRLGRERFASGVVFDARGYAVTVSYVLLDAESVEAQTRDGKTVRAHVAGIDLESGLGIVKLDGPGPWVPAAFGDSRDAVAGAVTGTVGVDEDNDLVAVTGALRSIRRFSGYWEYMLDRALFIAPASPSWGGSAVVDERGQVIGIASLRLGEKPYVNLAIPVELFVPVKDELIAAGRVVSRRPRPWLGLYTVPTSGGVVIDDFSPQGPAATAGFVKGDRIVSVNGVSVGSQEEFYQQLWMGEAGDVIRVAVERAAAVHVIAVRSIDRYRLLHAPPR